MLVLKNFNLNILNSRIISDFNINISINKKTFIIGPNGSGKSSLLFGILGKESYSNIYGSIFFKNLNIKCLSPDQRSLRGIFLCFQNPIEIPGVSNIDFLFNIYKIKKRFLNEDHMDYFNFIDFIRNITEELTINNAILNMDLNYCLSGGEKKMNEIIQMKILNPDLILLDELDSGLDADFLKKLMLFVYNFVCSSQKSFLMVTHHFNIIDNDKNNEIFLIINGKNLFKGSSKILSLIKFNGYSWFLSK